MNPPREGKALLVLDLDHTLLDFSSRVREPGIFRFLFDAVKSSGGSRGGHISLLGTFCANFRSMYHGYGKTKLREVGQSEVKSREPLVMFARVRLSFVILCMLWRLRRIRFHYLSCVFRACLDRRRKQLGRSR